MFQTAVALDTLSFVTADVGALNILRMHVLCVLAQLSLPADGTGKVVRFISQQDLGYLLAYL